MLFTPTTREAAQRLIARMEASTTKIPAFQAQRDADLATLCGMLETLPSEADQAAERAADADLAAFARVQRQDANAERAARRSGGRYGY